MNGVVSYLLAVTSAALLVAVLLTLVGQGHMAALVKLLAGIFMAVTVASPLVKLELPDLDRWFSDLSADGQEAASRGKEMANEAQRMIIKERLEAYILDKAAAYGALVTVEVSVDEEGVPVGVTLTGAVSPAVKKQLMQMIGSDLGLGEEVQQWSS